MPDGFTMRNFDPIELPEGYVLQSDGLFYRAPAKDGNASSLLLLAAPFEIVAECCDECGRGWGLLLRWHDRSGTPHQWIMLRRLIHAEGNAIAAELEDAGLSCSPSRAAHERLKVFFGGLIVTRRMRCVDRAGWHQPDAGPVFVLPDGQTFGAGSGSIVLQPGRLAAGRIFGTRGSLDGWRHNVARFAVGNHRLALALSAAFAGPLLDVTGDVSGGIHLVGQSQTGKTTALRVAASVWGPGDAGGQIRTWRATANGLEGVATECSDGLLFLDELGQADPREVSQAIYLLTNEGGKARANRSGGARPRHSWRLIFLSTGEVDLHGMLAEIGKRPTAGQDVRLINLSADAGAGLGIFQDLHDRPSAGALAEHLREATRTDCGTAGPAFLKELAEERSKDPASLRAVVCATRDEFVANHLPPSANGQVRSVAARFGLIAAAGEMAQTYDVLPWPEGEATRAAASCFDAWLAGRGGTGASEDIAIVKRVRAFVAAHGASRFELIDDTAPADQRVINRAG